MAFLTREQIIANIQALQKLAENNNNESQIEAALLKIQELVSKYNIQQHELGEKSKYVCEEIESFGRMTPDKKVIGNIVNHFIVRPIFFVRKNKPAYRNSHTVHTLAFYGTKENIEIAKFIYFQFKIVSEGLWQFRRKQNNWSRGDRPSYICGLIYGYIDKLIAQKQKLEQFSGSNALIVINSELDNAFKNEFNPSQMKQSEVKVDILSNGYSDGKNIELNKGIGVNKSNQLTQV